MGNMGPWQILLILAVILLIFGAARLPALAKSLGQSARVFRGEIKQMKDDGTPAEPSASTVQSKAAEPQPGYTVNGEPAQKLPGEEHKQ
ncbi:hypothetical protein GCM10027064_19980 [Microbacterium petrolearium]|jgi:sec-independent protein translocase protein TatA